MIFQTLDLRFKHGLTIVLLRICSFETSTENGTSTKKGLKESREENEREIVSSVESNSLEG